MLGLSTKDAQADNYCSLFIFAQVRADFYGGVIRTKFVSLCLFVRMGYFLHIYFKMEIEFKLTQRKLTKPDQGELFL